MTCSILIKNKTSLGSISLTQADLGKAINRGGGQRQPIRIGRTSESKPSPACSTQPDSPLTPAAIMERFGSLGINSATSDLVA